MSPFSSRQFMTAVALGCCMLAHLTNAHDHEESGEEMSHDHEHDEESEEEEEETVVVVCIVLFLIFMTILFENMKEHVEEHSQRNLRPIIEKLFGELTVLGFLSLSTFVITKIGFFDMISKAVFGEKGELLEIFEVVHFSIFFVMVFFVVQVMVLVGEAGQTEDEWFALEKAARDPDRSASIRRQAQDFRRNDSVVNIFGLFPGMRNRSRQAEENLVLYKALREEFILNRAIHEPFTPEDERHRVDPDFNFARYLGLCLSNQLVHAVEIHQSTWFMFAILTIVYYAYCWLVDEDWLVLCWTWVVLGWLVFIFNLFFERHLIKIRKALTSDVLVSHSDETDPDSSLLPSETTGINQTEGGLPDWCHIDVQKYMDNRPWLAKCLVGGTPERQATLYWLDSRGPRFYLLILQVNLVFLGLFSAMHILEFAKPMYETQQFALFALYVISATLPAINLIYHKKHLVMLLAQVCNLGIYRKPGFISQVHREEKTIRIVRVFLVIYKMRRFASQVDLQIGNEGERTARLDFDPVEIRDLGECFDAFDRSKDGHIEHAELEKVMKDLGCELSPEKLSDMIKMLDQDGDGLVSREEFINWYAENAAYDDLGIVDRAKFLFAIFDDDESGEITIAEFQHKLDALNFNFNVDEVGAIVNALDESNNGTIGLHEFVELMKRYNPKELGGEQTGPHH